MSDHEYTTPDNEIEETDHHHSKLDALIHMYGFQRRLFQLQLTDSVIYSDAQNPRFVYEWRQEQERTLRAAKGNGMTEEQVNHFVDGCPCPPPRYAT